MYLYNKDNNSHILKQNILKYISFIVKKKKRNIKIRIPASV